MARGEIEIKQGDTFKVTPRGVEVKRPGGKIEVLPRPDRNDRRAKARLERARQKAGDSKHELLDYKLDPNVIDCLKEGVSDREILLVDCPYCGHTTYYSGGFTSSCTWCGNDVADQSDDARTVEDEILGACFDEYRPVPPDPESPSPFYF